MRVNNKKIISSLFIILGITIILYPEINEKYNTYRQKNLLLLSKSEL